jgi:hypothetical protein
MSKNKKKEELAVGRDLTIESFRNPEEPYVVFKHRIKAQVIDETACVRGPVKILPPHNSFLDYLEFRMNQPSTIFEKIFGKRI